MGFPVASPPSRAPTAESVMTPPLGLCSHSLVSRPRGVPHGLQDLPVLVDQLHDVVIVPEEEGALSDLSERARYGGSVQI